MPRGDCSRWILSLVGIFDGEEAERLAQLDEWHGSVYQASGTWHGRMLLPEIDNLIKSSSGGPLIDLASVPARLRSEVELCIKADVIFPFGNSEMERTGAIALFSDKGGG